MLLHKNLKEKEEMNKLFEMAISSREEGKEVFVAFLDGNCMKAINDNYGHLAGDQTISRISHIICRHAGEYNSVIKFGGDEFVLILPNKTQSEVKVFVNQLQILVINDEFLKEKVGGFSISIGVVEYDSRRHDEAIDSVLKEADSLMYIAKTNLENYTAFSFEDLRIEKSDRRRRENLIYDVMREYFRSIIGMVKIQYSEFNDRILIEAARNIWRINGKRVITMGTPTETMAKIITEYKFLKTKLEQRLNKKIS